MIRAQAARDSRLLAELVRQARGLAQDVRPIRPRAATAVALTAADGGNNAVAFNPFSLQIVRVVDSQGKELFLDVVSPGTDVGELSRKHLAERTALGGLMTDLGVSELRELSPHDERPVEPLGRGLPGPVRVGHAVRPGVQSRLRGGHARGQGRAAACDDLQPAARWSGSGA